MRVDLPTLCMPTTTNPTLQDNRMLPISSMTLTRTRTILIELVTGLRFVLSFCFLILWNQQLLLNQSAAAL